MEAWWPGTPRCARTAVRAIDKGRFDAEIVPIQTAHGLFCVDEHVNGSGCSLGHPVAATGARMLVTLVHELRRRGGGIGVAAMCAGGGMGSAAVIEVPAP